MENRGQIFIEDMPKSIGSISKINNYLRENGFFVAPASTKYHGNYEGGLFDHSRQTMRSLVELTWSNHLIWSRIESPYIVGMFHDLCKIDAYREDSETLSGWNYNDDSFLLKGHGDKSVMLLSTLMQLTEEEVMCIRYHMGAFTDKEEWNYYTRAVHKFPNVLWTHQADMIASHVMGV